MNITRKLTFAALGLAFALSFAVAESYAQRSRSWSGYDGGYYTTYSYPQYSRRDRRSYNRGNRYGWLSWRERRRLQRMRYRRMMLRDRYYNRRYANRGAYYRQSPYGYRNY